MTSREDNEKKIAALRVDPDVLCRTRSGSDWEIEMLADQILADGRRGVMKHSELRDYLSPSQLDLRRSREIMPTQGYPEAHIFSGLYRRAYNPDSRGTRTSNAVPTFSESSEHE